MDDLTKTQFLEVSSMIEKNMKLIENKLDSMSKNIDDYARRVRRIERVLMTYRIWATVIAFMITFSVSYIFDLVKVLKNVTRSFAKVH
jgi:phage-related minor tail protein